MVTGGFPLRIKRPHGWIAEKKLVMKPYCKSSEILLSYGSAANMIRSQRCIGQTIANEENEAASLCTCIFAGA